MNNSALLPAGYRLAKNVTAGAGADLLTAPPSSLEGLIETGGAPFVNVRAFGVGNAGDTFLVQVCAFSGADAVGEELGYLTFTLGPRSLSDSPLRGLAVGSAMKECYCDILLGQTRFEIENYLSFGARIYIPCHGFSHLKFTVITLTGATRAMLIARPSETPQRFEPRGWTLPNLVPTVTQAFAGAGTVGILDFLAPQVDRLYVSNRTGDYVYIHQAVTPSTTVWLWRVPTGDTSPAIDGSFGRVQIYAVNAATVGTNIDIIGQRRAA